MRVPGLINNHLRKLMGTGNGVWKGGKRLSWECVLCTKTFVHVYNSGGKKHLRGMRDTLRVITG